ncbi:MAG: glycoside hydrolase family 130 protein [Candidatus Saganbacteria bacterium]|nr:glycoside hydrolase family 130 protein [Candidatus Saganbacteria bacterium]
MNILPFLKKPSTGSAYEDERNIYVGNLSLDDRPASDLKDLSGFFKRILHKRIDRFCPDKRKVITRFLEISDAAHLGSIIKRALDLDKGRISAKLREVMAEFSKRHRSIENIFMRNYLKVAAAAESISPSPSKEKKLLIGSLFTMEYSYESTSLFNPSVVLYPKQNGLKKGQVRVVFCFRATGEGHISSIIFRSAVIDKNNDIYLEPISRFASTPAVNMDPTYEKKIFAEKLKDIGSLDETAAAILGRLPDNFSYNELMNEIKDFLPSGSNDVGMASKLSPVKMKWLADCNYEVSFPPDQLISERVLFPVSPTESNGMEDARFVRFTRDSGDFIYYATYTAYNGISILPQILETKDFHHFKMSTLNGPFAKDKGMALFPRKINGRYAMISRSDGENLFLMYSDNLNFWYEAVKMQEPSRTWEMVKIGNCGSPIETKEGWLLLTHGIGPMRKYCIGIELLDLNDPSKVIAKMEEPLLSPTEEERDGYVPNVVYSCGSILIRDKLIIPYAESDSVSSIAVIRLNELLDKLLKKR